MPLTLGCLTATRYAGDFPMPAATTRTAAAKKTADAAPTSLNDLADRSETLLADAAKRAEAIVRDGVETLRAQTRAYADTAAQRLETAERLAAEHVRERPISSVLGAIGVGILIGLMLGGRRH